MPDRYVAFTGYTWQPKAPKAWIVVKGGPSYKLTSNDVLWTARSVVYEGGDPRDVLWTLTQRFTVVGVRNYSSFADFVRGFSQPVNPDWQRNGQFCRPGGKYAGRDECSAARLTKRDAASSASWGDLWAKDPEAIELVLAWAAAQLKNPLPRSTNFADEAVSAGFLARSPESVVLKRAGNVYIMEPYARGWDRNHVTMASMDGSLATADGIVPGSKLKQGLAVGWSSLLKPWG